MYIQQLYTNCLAQAAYYIESNGEAAIIDPIRETTPYTQLAAERGAKIKYILETHFHADFVSGHVDLAKATGATIVYGPGTQTGFESKVATDGELLPLGNINLKVLHTPGHTLESSCYLLIDENGKENAVFSGDTLFVGEVGRPDLLDGIMTKEELAGMMYDSLRNKLMPLPDEVLLYPAHGPGSACGKNIGKETWSTMGQQKETNYVLQQMSKEEFISAITTGIAPAPAYFFEDAKMNKNGTFSIEEIEKNGLQSLSLEIFENETKGGATILDCRPAALFELGFIPGSINVGLDGQFAIWAANVLNLHTPLLIVSEVGKEKEAVDRLARVGFATMKGYLEGGFEVWQNAGKRIDMIISIDAEEFALDAKHSKAIVLDVRKPSEQESGYVAGAKLLPLSDIQANLNELDKEQEYIIHCAGGYRSMVAASLLKSKGFQRVKNVYGGFGQIKTTDIPLEMPKAVGV
ncbi:MAG: MBL fold metallo-hydrolase [Flavobacteriaceae bacterium]|nr:MBL fold metallo-hydrolase [Flavobacteriaceae bacterium]